MEEAIHQLISGWPLAGLIGVVIASLAVLGKGADWLVEEAVGLSLRSGLPPVVVGATVVSLGTTSPEAFVSVLAAIRGNSEIALGNAVGSIICDTGLILGLACLVAPLPFDRRLVNSQGWVQFGSAVLLVALTMAWRDPLSSFTSGGVLYQAAGFLLVGLLLVYLVWSVRLARSVAGRNEPDTHHEVATRSVPAALLRMAFAVGLVLISSSFLISAAQIIAERLGVPPSIVAATMIALGTSLPELVIVMTAVMKGQGELAIGNVIGADILNVLFVAGIAAAVTPQGLYAGPEFFTVLFPGMLFLLLVFRFGIWTARDNKLSRITGGILMAAYIAVQVLVYQVNVGPESNAASAGEPEARRLEGSNGQRVERSKSLKVEESRS